MRASSCFVGCFVACAVVVCGGCIDRYLDPPEVRAPTVAVFDPARGALPFPHDALLLGSGDGTVDVPIDDDAPAADPRRALNELNGFGLTGTIRIPFSRALDPGSVVVGDSVRVFYGFAGAEAADGDVAVVVDKTGDALLVVPLTPWPEGVTVVVIVTNDLKDDEGAAVDADRVFKLARSENSLIDGGGHAVKAALISDDEANALEPLRALTSLACTPARVRGVVDEALVMCLPVTVQRASDRLRELDDDDAAVHAAGDDELRVLPVPIVSTDALGLAGAANVSVGAARVARYVPLDRPLDGVIGTNDGRVQRSGDEVIPLLVTAPRLLDKANKPPVVVFQHGVTRDRTDVLAVADAFAAAGIVVVSADLPLHGLTGDAAHVFAAFNDNIDADSAAYQSAFFDGLRPRERTLDLDLVTTSAETGATTAITPDGVVDPSGTHLLNLASLLTSRDTLTQAVVDVRAVARAAANLDLDGDGVSDVDGRVFFVGHSLGSIVGANACALDHRGDNDDDGVFAGCVLVDPGAQLAQLFRGSPTFGPVMLNGLANAGVTGADVDAFVALAQIVLDGIDPWLTLPSLQAQTTPLLVIDVKDDQVVPERVPFFPLAGGLPFITALGLADVDGDRAGAGVGVPQRVRVRFGRGDHTSLLAPSDPAVTAAMQTLVVTFVKSGGRVVDVDEAVLDGVQ